MYPKFVRLAWPSPIRCLDNSHYSHSFHFHSSRVDSTNNIYVSLSSLAFFYSSLIPSENCCTDSTRRYGIGVFISSRSSIWAFHFHSFHLRLRHLFMSVVFFEEETLDGLKRGFQYHIFMGWLWDHMSPILDVQLNDNTSGYYADIKTLRNRIPSKKYLHRSWSLEIIRIHDIYIWDKLCATFCGY